MSTTGPQALLHFHRKLQTWLPPGGHVEKNETPYEAAVREVTEETGLMSNQINFIPNGDQPTQIDERAKILRLPHLLLEELIEEDHYHLDWIFYARIDPKSYQMADNEEFKWFTQDEIEQEVNIFENVKQLALRGLSAYYD